MKKIYIHIGIGKTGTTSIQNFLFTNKKYFETNGLLYPSTGIRGTGHHNLAELSKDELNINIFNCLNNEIVSSKCETIVLSSEFFIYCTKNYISAMSDFFMALNYNIKIVICVRNQLSFLPSVFLQWQKVGHNYCKNIESFHHTHKKYHDFNKLITPWEVNFTEKNIVSFLFHKNIISNNVVHYFLKVIEINCHIPDYPISNANPSLIPEFGNLISIIDDFNLAESDRKFLIDELLKLSEKFKNHSSLNLISEELYIDIVALYKKSNEDFSKKYLSAKESKLFCFNEKIKD